MPTILLVMGWRFFFYANGRHEPPHVHCRKGDAEGKYWLYAESYDAVEAHSYNMSPADRRVVRKIIFDHFDYIVAEWNRFQEGR